MSAQVIEISAKQLLLFARLGIGNKSAPTRHYDERTADKFMDDYYPDRIDGWFSQDDRCWKVEQID
jgi:hypothetical protein